MSEQVEPYEPPAGPDPEAGVAAADAEFDRRYPPLRYDQLHRAGRHEWWRGLVGVVVLAAAMMLLAPFVMLLPFVVWFAASGADVLAGLTDLTSLDDPRPVTLAYLNLSLAAAIPVTWFLTRVLHGLRPRWLTSVLPRMRWRFFGLCLGLSVVALVATLAVSAVLPSAGAGVEPSGEPNPWSTTMRDFLLVVVLLTPLQAAGEEYAFRGYLTQVLGGVFGRAWVAVLVPALLFAAAHGSQSVPVFLDRLAFGLVAGVLVVATGGLEAAIAMHVLNNFLAFGVTLAFGDIASALNPGAGSWWMIPATLTQSLVYLGLAVGVARRTGLSSRASGRALVASLRRV